MKPIWSGILGSLEGAIAATFVSGIVVSLFQWHIDSNPKIAAFISAVLLGATLGWFIGAAMARRKAPHPAARFIGS